MANSYNLFTGNGSQTVYTFTFDYIKKADIQVRVNNVLKTETTDYAINENAKTVTFVSAPGNGLSVKISRSTDTAARTVDFTDGSNLSEVDLDNATKQLFYLAQELYDSSDGSAASSASSAASSASAAATSASNAATSASSAASSAASVNLPTMSGNGGNYLRANAGATQLEYRTASQQRGDLALDSSYAGNPNGNVAGTFIGQHLYDSTNNSLWVCTTTGVAASAKWQQSPFINSQKVKQGFLPKYASASTITLTSGQWSDSTGKYLLKSSSTLTLDLSTSGLLGRDTGSETSNTWYYVHLIGKSTDPSAISAVFSTTNGSAPSYPSGYDIYVQLPIAIRNDNSSNIINFAVDTWGPDLSSFVYLVQNSYYNGSSVTGGIVTPLTSISLTSGSYAGQTQTITSFAPANSRMVDLHYLADGNSTFLIRTSSAESNDFGFGSTAGGVQMGMIPNLRLTSGQQFDIRRMSGTANIWVDVHRVYITETQ